jgi:hypothetical protein
MVFFIKHGVSRWCSVEPIPGQCPFTGRYGISGTYMIYHYIFYMTYSIWHILYDIFYMTYSIWHIYLESFGTIHVCLFHILACAIPILAGEMRDSRHHSQRFTCHWLVIYGSIKLHHYCSCLKFLCWDLFGSFWQIIFPKNDSIRSTNQSNQPAGIHVHIYNILQKTTHQKTNHGD